MDPDGNSAQKGDAFAILGIGIAEATGLISPQAAKNMRMGINGRRLGKKRGKKTYQTYTKKNNSLDKTYSGRTSGTDTPKKNVANRDKKHHKNQEGYGPAKLDKSSTSKDAIRGREQQNIDSNGGAQSQGGTSGNRINGISDKNKKIEQYMHAAREGF